MTFVVAEDPARPPPGLERAVYAIGNFDGVHRGHAAVFACARALAARLGAKAAALTFEPHPADFFAGRPTVFRLTPRREKTQAFAAAGLDGVVVLPFDASLAAKSALEFIEDLLVARLAASGVVIGADFRFGHGRQGSAPTLVATGAARGFAVEVVDLLEARSGAVSSSAIRNLLERGDVVAAATLLGRPYVVSGEVLPGRRLGRQLAMPTANIALDAGTRLAHGIYAVRVLLDGVWRPGVASFGTRPTVDGGTPLLEAHLLGYEGDLYGRTLDVAFIDRIRDEEKFADLATLKSAMAADARRAEEILARS